MFRYNWLTEKTTTVCSARGALRVLRRVLTCGSPVSLVYCFRPVRRFPLGVSLAGSLSLSSSSCSSSCSSAGLWARGFPLAHALLRPRPLWWGMERNANSTRPLEVRGTCVCKQRQTAITRRKRGNVPLSGCSLCGFQKLCEDERS